MYIEKTRITPAAASEILQRGVDKIAPLWSLENFVAVNPYLGLSDKQFTEAMDFLHKSGKIKSTLPIDFYLKAINAGRITSTDLDQVLKKKEWGFGNADQFLASLADSEEKEHHVYTLAETADELHPKKWSRFMVDRFSFWASAYFDENQATWQTSNKELTPFKAWKQEAEIDRSTEAMGLKGFRKLVKSLPGDHTSATMWALEILDIPAESLELYINALLMKINGWAGLAARIDWDARLAGKESHLCQELLAIALVWEMCLMECLQDGRLHQSWQAAKTHNQLIAKDEQADPSLNSHLILQEAFDHAHQRTLVEKINAQEHMPSRKEQPKVQAVFCIDVRSELYRRHLEAANAEVETIGFAGFFGFPIEYVPLGQEKGSSQCPVLLTPSHTVKENLDKDHLEKVAIEERTLNRHVSQAWSTFRAGAISCFSFVSPMGLFYLPKLLTDALGLTRPVPEPKHAGLQPTLAKTKGVNLEVGHTHDHVSGIAKEERIRLATAALKAMSLTDNFARLVMITGHGASTVNNPHATGLDCGACGGNSGEANAKVAAAVLNDPDVRAGLRDAGIHVPESTHFLAALHDTTTDNVTIFHKEHVPKTHREDLIELEYTLSMAGMSARKERGERMKIESGNIRKQILQRSKDWSQVRPEWGLAGCSSFIVAPRERTAQLSFGGKAFMHNYNWKKDTDFGVLELIMTAPMVVTSWINLQYYASTVDNKKFGAGNKTLHNVVGGVGVLEGFAGDLRVGLPWQSIHDGQQYQHEPLRLNVIIEAPVDEMSKILSKHESIRQLCDNEWIHLLAMNEEGKVAYRYIGDLEWEVI